MEKIKIEPNENKSEEENLDINLNIQRPKSTSFEIHSNNKKTNISDYKRVRFYSENIPSNFVPKLKPIKSEINPTPMKLNHLNFKTNSIIINEIPEINEKLVISFEKEEFFDSYELDSNLSDNDSDYSSYEYEKLNFKIEDNKNDNKNNQLSFIQNLRKEMNKIRYEIKKQRKSSSNDDNSLKKSILESILEKENQIEFGTDNKIQRGFSILDVLTQNNPNHHFEFYKKLSFDEEFIL